MKKIPLIIFLLSSILASSQDVFMQNGTVNRCSGVLYDSGGGGANYGSNETFVLTICPENAGQKLQLDFTTFSTQLNTDFLTIYDGDSTAAPAFGSFAGGSAASPGFVVATADNTSGCITLEFASDGTNNGPGWAATISCLTPCQTINSQIDSTTPAPNSLGYIRVCPNDPITLNGSGTFSVDGTGATYEWDLGDGNTVSGQTATFSYSDPGVYIVNLNIRDTNTSIDPLGCNNNNLINQVIQVATEPEFTGTQAAQTTICFGETTTIEGVVNPVEFINDCTPPVSGITFLPDGNGRTFETSVTVDCYDSEQTLTDINQLVSICLTMEHSYLGDLDIEIISPNGQTVRMHDQGGGSANLGIPWATATVDGNSGNTTPGTGAQYCFVPGNANPTLIGGIQTGGVFPNGNGPATYTDSFVPAGNYSSVFPLTGLVGSPLNGNWTIRVVDNLGADNGHIFAWSIEFDPALQPPELSFTPVITSEGWDPDTTIINTTGNTITVEPPTAGTYCYTYRMIDDFGCEYSEEVCIDMLPEIITATPNNLFLCNPGLPPYIFDLSENTPIILAPAPTPADLIVTYHETQADADNNVSPISNPETYDGTDGQIIYVRVEYLNSGCYITDTLTLNITANPTINSVPDLVGCDDPSNDGFAEFDLELQSLGILGAQPISDYIVTYYTSFVNADTSAGELSSPYTNISNPQPIFVRIERIGDPLCNNVSVLPLFDLVVNPSDDASFTMIPTCDGGTATITGATGGSFSFDTAPTDAAIIDAVTGTVTGGTPGATYNIVYVTSGVCPLSSTEVLNVLPLDDSGFSMTPTCDGATAVITGDGGGQFIFNPLPTDAAIIDSVTGTVSGATPGSSYTVEYTTNGTCPSTRTNSFTVNSLPIIFNPTILSVCDDNIPDGITQIDLSLRADEITGGNPQYIVSYHLTPLDANSGTGALSVPYTNISNPQTIYVRVEDSNTGCFDTVDLELRVEQAPNAFVPSPLEYCDLDNDGLGVFTLTDADLQVTAGDPDLTVTYHETLTEAQNGANPQSSPYSNINAYMQTLYARVESSTIATGCETIVELQLIVGDTPQIGSLTPLTICDTDDDGLAQFDLTEKDSEIYGSQDPSQYTLTYHTSQSDADTGSSAIANVTNVTNTINPQTIYVRLVGSNGCTKTGMFEIMVVLPPTAVQPTPLELCDDAIADQMTTFDLTSKDSEITGGNSSWTVSYHATDADAQAGTGVIDPATSYTNMSVNGAPANPQTLYVRVTDTDTGCTDFTILTLRVLPNPTPGPDPLDIELCDDINAGDGREAFDLTVNETYIINGESGVSPSYHTSLGDAEANIGAITDPTMYSNTNTDNTPQTIYVRVTNDTTGCHAIVDFDILVSPVPEVVAVTDYIICEVNTDGFVQFDLSGKDAEVLNGQDPSRFTVSYHATQMGADNLTGALMSPYANTSNPQQIFIAITDNLTGCSISTPSFEIEVDNGAEANPDLEPIEQVVCDALGDNDGLGQFDLTENDIEVLDSGQDAADFTVTYYTTQADAELGVNSIPYIYENISNPQVIYVRVDNDTPDALGGDSSICYAVTELTLRVNLNPIFDLEESYTLCIDTNGSEVIDPPVLDTGLDASQYGFVWSLGGTELPGETGASLMASQSGTYTVVVTNIATGCTNTDSAEVVISSPPSIVAGVSTQAFSENHVIVAEATGDGQYEYSLDDGPWQASGTFEGVSFGEHTVTARDINGCGEASDTVTVLDYPHFFTPNGDGRNETWNIVGFGGQANAKIYIFDRFGKLLKQISPSGLGWNGTYNGRPMPTSDYWFTAEYSEPVSGEQKQFRAHFTLKR